MRNIAKALVVANTLVMAAISGAQAGTVLDAIRARGAINCGTHQSQPAFAYTDSAGKWHGFDAEFCAAVAAAVFGDATKVNYVPISFSQNFTSLQSGEVDIVSRSVTWTFSRDFDLGMTFVGVTLYGGPTVMVPKAAGVKSFKELNGASICMLGGSNNEAVLKDYFRAHNLQYKQVVFDDQKVMFAAY
jgi:general L-amino acid transport system substrate-binding protein